MFILVSLLPIVNTKQQKWGLMKNLLLHYDSTLFLCEEIMVNTLSFGFYHFSLSGQAHQWRQYSIPFPLLCHAPYMFFLCQWLQFVCCTCKSEFSNVKPCNNYDSHFLHAHCIQYVYNILSHKRFTTWCVWLYIIYCPCPTLKQPVLLYTLLLQ